MKKIVLITGILAGTFLDSSAQTEFQKFFWSKKYKASLAERDEICATNKKLRQDTSELGKSLRSLTAKHDSLYLAHALLISSNNDLQLRYKSLAESSDQKLAAL